MLLQGAYEASSGLMRDDLRSKGYLPITQPYNVPPFNHAGGETLSTAVLAVEGDKAVVDWVLLELHDASSDAVLGSKAVMVQRDGLLANPQTGANTLDFMGVAPGNYRIGIRHRNHLGVTSHPVALAQTATVVDFTGVQAGDLTRQVVGDKALLWAGDADANTQIIGGGPGTDVNAVLGQILTEPDNSTQGANYRLNGYFNTDLNLDGVTIFAGPGTDLNLLKSNVLLHPDNLTTSQNYIVKATGEAPVTTTSGVEDTRLEDALRTGDASSVTTKALLDAGIAQAQSEADYCKAELANIYPAGLVQTLFPLRSAYMASTSPRNLPLHAAYNNGAVQVYSWMGSKASGTRYAVLGTNVFSFTKVNTDLKDNTLNVLRWLLKRAADVDVLNEKLTVLVPNYWDRVALNDWLSANSLSHQWTVSVDAALLKSGAFDLYLGDVNRDVTEVQQAFAANKPVLVFNNWYQPNDANLAEFGLLWRWYAEQTVGDFASVAAQCAQSSDASVIQTTLTSLRDGLPDFTYEASDCPDSVGTVKCDLAKVTDAAGHSVEELFNQGATAIRTQLQALDYQGSNLFAQADGSRLLKIAVLLADKYRADIHYPMDKVTTTDTAFYQALFADYGVHYSRPDNVYQADMGDFTTAQTKLNAASTTSKTRTYTPTVFGEWTSTGLYAPPGKTITVRRTDSGTSEAKLRFNFLRESTRLWNDQQYSRPRYMSSPVITLAAGQTYTFSTPYGGPLYVGWMGVDSDATPFTLAFDNVLENPLLQVFDAIDIQSFLNDILLSDSDWVDIKTPYAEIHSLKSYMLKSFARQDGNEANSYTPEDVQAYIEDLNHYLIAGNYAYAGFSGAGLAALDAATSDFCTRFGLSSVMYDGSTRNLCTDAAIHVKPKIQHINADVNAACGALCSGNPFDSYAPIEPLGWGENHEMGHNLQRARLKIYEGRSTEVSNNIFPLHTQWQWTLDQGLSKHPSQTRPANQEAFTILQAARKAGTAADTKHPLWSGTGTYDNAFERLSFYMQLAYSQQSWGVYTKLYLLERIFTDAIKTDAKWDAVKTRLGFGHYTRTDASAISGNDFMYIGASTIAGKDYSAYFAAWGIEVTQAAKDQVAANGVSGQVPALFYYVNKELPAVMPTAADTIPLDGTSVWFDPTP